jgi:hypothetical protein
MEDVGQVEKPDGTIRLELKNAGQTMVRREIGRLLILLTCPCPKASSVTPAALVAIVPKLGYLGSTPFYSQSICDLGTQVR